MFQRKDSNKVSKIRFIECIFLDEEKYEIFYYSIKFKQSLLRPSQRN